MIDTYSLAKVIASEIGTMSLSRLLMIYLYILDREMMNRSALSESSSINPERILRQLKTK